MERIINFFKNKWVIEFIGLVLLSVLVWFVGPLIAIAGSIPLESELSRIICIVLFFSVWLIYRLLMRLLSVKRDRQLMTDLSQGSGNAGNDAQSAAIAEQDVLGRGFAEALNLLKTTRYKQGSKQYLYELPWYAIIGAPGSG